MTQRSLAAAIVMLLGFGARQSAVAQNLDGLKVQIYGYVTQAFLYSTTTTGAPQIRAGAVQL